MASVFEKILLVGTSAAFSAIETKDANKLYFLSDTKQIYKGSDLYTDAIRKVTVRPTTPAVDILYNINDETIEYYDGTNWVVVRPKMSSGIDVGSDGELVTAKQVYDFVMAQLEDVTSSENTVTGVAASGTKNAALNVTNGAGTSSEVVVPGVVTVPSYDATTRTITLPVSNGDPVVIALGKDIFVDSTADNKYNTETGNIELHLNDGTTIEIPASSLVDTYTGGATTTATVTVSDGNVITVAVKLSTATDNALSVDAENGGLYLSLANYYNKTEIDTKVNALSDTIDAVSQKATANETAINVLNGDATTEGSVKKQIADAKSEIGVTTNDLTTRVTALEDAFGFGTF